MSFKKTKVLVILLISCIFLFFIANNWLNKTEIFTYNIDKEISQDTRNSIFKSKYNYIEVEYENKGEGVATVHIQDKNGILLDDGQLVVEPNKKEIKTINLKKNKLYSYTITSKGGATEITGHLVINPCEEDNHSYKVDKEISQDTRSSGFKSKHNYIEVEYENKGEGASTVHIQDKNGILLDDGQLVVEPNKKEIKTINLNKEKLYFYTITSKNGATEVTGHLIIKSSQK